MIANYKQQYRKKKKKKKTMLVVPISLTEATSKTVIIPLSNVDFISVLPMIMECGAEC